MSKEDKAKLDGIATGANKYTLPTANGSTLGGVKTTSSVTSNSGYTACPIISGVPYYKDTDTKYTLPTASSSTLGGVKVGNNLKIASGVLSSIKTVTHKYRYDVTSKISANTNFTIPCSYKVGADNLDVYYLGERLTKTVSGKEGHYKEVGTSGSASSIIQLDGWSAGDLTDISEYFDFVVRSEE